MLGRCRSSLFTAVRPSLPRLSEACVYRGVRVFVICSRLIIFARSSSPQPHASAVRIYRSRSILCAVHATSVGEIGTQCYASRLPLATPCVAYATVNMLRACYPMRRVMVRAGLLSAKHRNIDSSHAGMHHVSYGRVVS